MSSSPPEETIFSRSLDWFALRVRTAAEPLACRQIEALGLEHFLPAYTTKKRWSDRMKTVQSPLFPGYVFCRLDPSDRLPILQCSTVIDIVRGAGRTPLPVDPVEITAIQKAIGSQQPVAPYPFLMVGQRVEIDRGPLKGTSGILVDNRKGLVLSVSLLQRSMVVRIDETWVSPNCYQHAGVTGP